MSYYEKEINSTLSCIYNPPYRSCYGYIFLYMNEEMYTVPSLDVHEFVVEQGFANSIEDPIENEEQDW